MNMHYSAIARFIKMKGKTGVKNDFLLNNE